MSVGLDEAGRGCLIGRVFAGAVVWNADTVLPKGVVIKDSKKMSKRQRDVARKFIEENAVAWAVSSADEHKINSINILQATMFAMHGCLDQLEGKFDNIIVDGSYFNAYGSIPHECCVGGDNLHVCISAASILAKTHHDEYILKLIKDNPELGVFDLENNMGYGTKKHMDGLRNHGYSKFHRTSFKLPTNIAMNHGG